MANEINLKFGASLGGSAKAVFSSLANGLKTVAKEMKTVAKEQVALGKTGAASSLNETAKVINKVAKDLGTYSKSADKATAATGRLTTITKQLSKSMQTYARYMVSSTILRSMTGGFNQATDAIQEHNQALHDLKAIMGATDAEVTNMENSILSVAKNTKFSIGETAGAMKLLGQAGFGAGDAINALEPIANFATGTLSSLQSTVNLVSTAIRVFNLETSETSRVVDIYANAVNKSKLTIDKLNTAMNYIGPIANAAGMSIEETASSMALLANAGLRASTIGTGMRRMLTLLLKPTESFKAAVYEAGYTMDDFNPKMNKFSDIVGKLGNVVTDAEGAVKMFGIRGASVISAFAEAGQSEFDRLAMAVSRTGTASKMAAEQMKGLTIAIKNMKDKFGVLAVAMGKAGFTQAWAMLVNLVRSLEDALISLANSSIGQFIMSAAGLVTVVLAVVAAITLFGKVLLSTKVALFTAQIVELTAQMLALSFSMSAFKEASLATSFSKLGVAVTSLKATFISLVASLTPVSWIIIAITTAIAAAAFLFKSYNDSLKETIQKNEAMSGSFELVLSGIDNYNKVLAKNGEDSKKFSKIQERLLKTFDKFGGALKGYTQLQDDLNEKLKDETVTIGESVVIWQKKAGLLKDSLVGNVRELSNEEQNLKEQTEAAAEVLRDENSSLAEQNKAVEILADNIRTKLLKAYADQVTASVELWQKSQILTNIWKGFKWAAVNLNPIAIMFKAMSAGIDGLINRFPKLGGIIKKVSHSIFGVGDSYEYLQRQADAGNEKAQEALAQINNYAASTAKELTKNINPLTLTKERIAELVAEATKLGDVPPAAIQRLTFELQKMGTDAKEAADSFNAAFGSDLSASGQDALSGILFILNESKDMVSDLASTFQELSESGDTSKLAGSLEALQAGLTSNKISAEEVKEVFGKLFEKLPAGEWQKFQAGMSAGMTIIKKDSVVMSAAIEAMTKAAFGKFGLFLGVLSNDFSDLSSTFAILLNNGSASMDQLTVSFTALSKKVKTLGDMDSLIGTFQELKSSGKITGSALERSFDAIRAAFKKAFKEPLKEVEDARKAVLTAAKGMSKAYEVEATAISDAFDTSFNQIASDFAALQNKINTMDLTNNQTQMRMTNAYRKFTSDSLQSIEQFKTKSIILLDQQSEAIVAKAKKTGVDVTAIEKKIGSDKAAVYKTTIAQYKTLMDKLVSLEQDRRAKIRTLEQDIANIRGSFKTDTRDMKRGLMSEAAAYADIKKELREVTNELNNSKTGTETWNTLLTRAKSLAGSLNNEVKQGDAVIVSKATAYNNSLQARQSLYTIEIEAKKEAIRLAEDEAQAAKTMQAQVAESAKKASEDLAKSISDGLINATTKFSEAIDRLVTLLDKNAPVIDASNLLDDINKEIDTLDSVPSLSVSIDAKIEDVKKTIAELGGLNPPTLDVEVGLETDGAYDSLNDLIFAIGDLEDEDVAVGVKVVADTLDDVKRTIWELSQVDDVDLTVKVNGEDVPLLEEAIDKITDKEVEISATVPTRDAKALSALQRTIDKLKNKEIVITTRYKTVGTPYTGSGQKAEGGIVEGFSSGGPVNNSFKKMTNPIVRKGSGNKDDVPTMLTKGEYVLKESAVSKLGTRFLNALNAGRFALSDLISNFATGGIVNPFSDLKNSLSGINVPNIAKNLRTGRMNITESISPTEKPAPVMDQLKDFGVVTFNTGKEKFKAIAHKDVVRELTAHLNNMKRFST